ncbi:MAG: hypothetical protein A2855_02415 [Candidatus Liptonbacteria bacterium RIFCSPHIGHO2_01_FULL_57_28]|uniref:DUF2283 domain-containing protein n=1 Tax=Candidatus Liptonbacteria bacterium RIFCSPHIGHO2_01_FULL_57_28 TaxID=1798647 RepID=A0A1G2CC05_9BACT|nr:MAG: hypothetical protein A2855_02415 [Candidatus Liptonbacteria bacterium RIFCSPHIGHO2_01_FULL_57_28]
MSIKLDKEADAIYITLKKGKVSKTETNGDYIMDYDRKGDLIGIEVIRFSAKLRSVERAGPPGLTHIRVGA